MNLTNLLVSFKEYNGFFALTFSIENLTPMNNHDKKWS